jgi:acyl dehydratase
MPTARRPDGAANYHPGRSPDLREAGMAFALEKLGEWSPEREFKVEADATRAYAAATNDPIPADRDGEVAPPVFAVVPVWGSLAEAMAPVIPPEVLLLVVHGEHDMRFHQPITPGMVLRSRAAPVGVRVKPSGTTAVTKVESRDAQGALAVEQYMTSFFRGVSDGEGAGEEAPSHKLEDKVRAGDPVATITQQIDADQTYRYADASGDRMPIHLDEEVAKQVGLPGIIIHGLCTMAFTSWAVVQGVAGNDPIRLKRLAVRFSRPVLPGQAITTRIWRVHEHDGVTVYGFETTNPDGELVIKDGLAEVAG